MKSDFMLNEINSRVKNFGNFSEISKRINLDKYKEKTNRKSFTNSTISKLIGALAVLMLVITSTILISKINFNYTTNISTSINKNHNWEIIYEEKENQCVEIPKWNDRSIIQKYSYFKYNNLSYDIWSTTSSKPILEKYIEKEIDSILITGYDVYEDTTHEIKANVYKIRNIDLDCAMGIQFDGDNKFYAYINNFYKFNSLEDIITKLNLKEYCCFKNAYYEFEDNDGTHLIRFDDFDDQLVWKGLLNQAKNENLFLNNIKTSIESFMSIRVNIEALGIEGSASWIGLDNKGFMEVHILSSNKSKSIFKLDVKSIDTFSKYLIDNIKGYEIIYIEAKDSTTNNEVHQTSSEKL